MRPVLELEDLFPLWGTLPRLTEAEKADVGGAVSRRRLDEVHQCVFCGERARTAVSAGPSDIIGPPCWLDLCHAHFGAVRDIWIRDPFLRDDVIVDRYSAWLERAASRS
ncbi:MAG TPA: hypothetical protein VGH54_29485 [Mycobacterium sp.]|jgi:hypothetical protein|uniref:hypothetical protein n=1 Tax=Mycobacterium sp. TaxID=1785 RepID=UPI002F429951